MVSPGNRAGTQVACQPPVWGRSEGLAVGGLPPTVASRGQHGMVLGAAEGRAASWPCSTAPSVAATLIPVNKVTKSTPFGKKI